MPLSRRSLFAASGLLRPLFAQPSPFTKYPFSLGVASGDPLANAVILWTRLAPDPLSGGGMPPGDVEVTWELGDENLRTILKRGTAIARSEDAHSLHVDVQGLEPSRWYGYRFRVRHGAGWIESPLARTRTAPSPTATLASYKFAYASCQKYEDGFYTAHRHLAADNLELVLFLGDYIYEGAAKSTFVRPHPKREAITLEDYRHRYSLYKTDPDLQAAHHAFPWMVIWDDHEVSNDYSGQVLLDTPALFARRDAGYRAFWEHMPLRAPRPVPGGNFSLYRSLSLGRLANLSMLDTRQYRSPHACGEAVQRPCAALSDPHRTLLGATQEKWLFDSLRQSQTAWQIIAQQIPFATVDREPGPGVSLNMDKWDGYPLDRQRLLDCLESRGKKDAVILTGDNHNHWVMELRKDHAKENTPPLTTEFLGTSISSTGDGSKQRETYAKVLPDNPHARYLNSQRGYVRCLITPNQWRTDFLTLPYVSKPGAPISTDASFLLTHGDSTPRKI